MLRLRLHGRPTARTFPPETQTVRPGKDQDGKQFKLSDYRGNVVLLYFWSEF
ncbi:MAG: redoxin domain-containing protein [Planctomycetes bacterium]|nr:redoxin domain-containing protein [Planctomycetota bacterium]